MSVEQINFLMGLHCHQPVDNFKYIFEDAYNKSYEPFLSVLERHPKIKLSLHYSGSLLEWIIANRPGFIERIKRLVDNGQVEILTGGYFEPIFPMIPSRDAKGQIEMLTGLIEKHFNFKPNGTWLAERVWSPELLSIFKDLNIKYTIVDDFHLKQAGLKDDEVFGHYTISTPGVEMVSNGFSVFASIKKLRYAMPFRETNVTIDFLKKLCGKENVHCVTFGDDCEKFGFWPHTYDWVYKRGWLDRFFTELEENDWIRTLTFNEALSISPSLGEIEIPHSSYAEMIQWCNGNFNNFFTKYPEANLMRKRMLFVSEKVEESENKKAKVELYKSQSNCAYWHGIFGGIYTNYLRQGIYSHIIKAEEILKKGKRNSELEVITLKNSPENIICARNKYLTLFIEPDYAGSLFEIDYKPSFCNLTNTMSRRYEPYHEKLNKRRKIDIEDLKRKVEEDASIDLYEVLGVKERNLNRFLNYDSYLKFSLLCHALDLGTSFLDFVESRHINAGKNGLFGPYKESVGKENGRLVINLKRESHPLRLNKCIIMEKEPEIFIKFDLENISPTPIKFIFGIEFNWSIEDPSFMRRRSWRHKRKLSLIDKFSRVRVDHVFENPINIWSFPVYTLNETERGIGKTFQEISLLFYRKLSLAGMKKFSLGTKVKIS